jgi:hypothetical protein
MKGKITDIKKTIPDSHLSKLHGRIKAEDNEVHYFYLLWNPGSENLEIGDQVNFQVLDPAKSDPMSDTLYHHRNTVRIVRKVEL